MAIWHQVGTVSSEALIEPRLQAHWAAQLPAAAGDAYLEKRSDDSQSNLGWNDDLQALLSHPLPNGLRVGLRIADLTVLLVEPDHNLADSFPLLGLTLTAAMDQLSERLAARGLSRKQLQPRDYDMPDHPVAQGKLFQLDEAGLAELAHWYANAHQVLGAIVLNEPAASPVRCWPHHFDIATLITFDPGKDPEQARSIGLGLSPGDNTYPEPYFYVNPWPYPQPETLPELMGMGRWHTDGWVGAVLTASQLVGVDTDEQLRHAERHLVAALHACSQVLGLSE